MTSVSVPRLLDRLKSAASVAGFGEDWISVARKAGVSDRTIRRWRKGQNDDPRLSTLAAVAGALRTTVGDLIGEGYPLATTPTSVVQEGLNPPLDPVPFAAPLLRHQVAAGEPSLQLAPKEPRPYFFRKEWLRRKGVDPDRDPERFAVFRLGDRDIARSMAPTIQPGSVLLVDRKPDRIYVPPRSIWIVRLPAEPEENPQRSLLEEAKPDPFLLTTKRVTLIDDSAVLESDNPDPRYAPRLVRCRPSDREVLLKGRVIWFATELE